MRALLLLLIFIVPPLPAQETSALARAAATITPRDVTSRIGRIAADSMQGRATPSPGLERTAEYVASEFRRAGLIPAGENRGYMQRFRITRWTIDSSNSALELTVKGRRSVARVGRDARYIAGRILHQPVRGPALLITAADSSGTLLGPDVRDRVVLLLADFSRPLPSGLNDQILELARAGPTAVLVISNRDSAIFAERLAAAARPRVELDAEYEGESGAPVLELHERAVGPMLAALGIDPNHLRASGQSQRRFLSALSIEVRLARRVLQQARVPNVVATLEGSDPLLKKEYLVYSAHIDHIGISPGQPDSVNNGADDNASGVAGLLELAEAFTQPGMRPKRSIMFLAPSAEEPGLLGSSYFTEHPPVPLDGVVANINMDLIGRNWDDSVIAVGLDQSDLGKTLQSVTRAHPRLRMTPIPDRWPEERIFYRSDHYNFARRGIPILFFTSGTHTDYHHPSDEVARIDGEKTARLLQLLFYLGAEVTDAITRPEWNATSYRLIVDRK